jgi:SAM-dependent methyltransferase
MTADAPGAAIRHEGKQQWGAEPEMFGPRHEHRLGMILRETAIFPPGARVLDGAVGLGQLGVRMRARGARVFGIDFSFDAARFATDAGVPSIVGDMTRLPFRDATFDAVTSGETLEHLERDGEAAGEIARALRSGGTAVVTVPALRALWSKSDQFQDHKRRYSRGELRALFERAGMTVGKAAYWGFPIVFLYDFLFILPLNISRARARARLVTSARSAGSSRSLVTLVRSLFKIDALFRWIPFGPGLILVARKR